MDQATGQPETFETPLDAGIRDYVLALRSNGVATDESCEGGPGHAYPEPTVCFRGEMPEGFRALSVAMANGLPVRTLKRVWRLDRGELNGPWWELTFLPPRPPGRLPWWREPLPTEVVQLGAVVTEAVATVPAKDIPSRYRLCSTARAVVVVNAMGRFLKRLVHREERINQRHLLTPQRQDA